MKKTLVPISLLFALACSQSEAAAPSQDLAGSSTPVQGFPQQVAETPIDRAISDRVREAILADNRLRSDAGTVRVGTRDGVVTLSGSVTTEQVRQGMEIMVGAVGSVIRVDNRLTVDPNPTTAPEPMETTLDRAISDRVRDALSQDSSFAQEIMGIHVFTQGGVVTLKGVVSSAPARERASVLAGAVGSVVRVDNQLTVRTE